MNVFTPSDMINLYVIDDDFLILEGFINVFNVEPSGFNVAGSSTILDYAMNEIASLPVDIILLDLHLKRNSSPREDFQRLKKRFPSIPVVILTFDYDTKWELIMMKLGANAYINKGIEPAALKKILQLVAGGDTIVSGKVSRLIVNSKRPAPTVQQVPAYFEIIEGIAGGSPLKEIAGKLNLEESTVGKRLKSIRDILQVKTNAEMIYKLFADPSCSPGPPAL